MISRILFIIFVVFVLVSYTVMNLLGWEMLNSGSRSRLGLPYITGYRGGK
jgi:phosphotransferase system  glucose/maltose/N-acetylglucosamine-specific IIC component